MGEQLTLGGRLIVFASMILEAWKFEREPIENQLELEAPDFWLTLERADVADRTDRPDSELIDDRAGKKRQPLFDSIGNIWSIHTVSPLIMSAHKKIVIPKENRHNIAFSFGITHFWGADIIRGDTVDYGG